MKKTFIDYLQANMALLEGFTVAKATAGVNHKDSGLILELERQIDNVVYDPEHEDGEAELAISKEYVKELR